MLTPLPYSITKKAAGKHYVWSDKLNMARDVAERFECEIFLTDAAYQIAKIKCDGVCLVLYPHTNTNLTTNIRVRDEQSKNAKLALHIVEALYEEDPSFNTFYMKSSSRQALAVRAARNIGF